MRFLNLLFYLLIWSINGFGQLQNESVILDCTVSNSTMSSQDQASYVRTIENDRTKYRMNGDSVIIPVVIHNLMWNHKDYIADSVLLKNFHLMNQGLANRGEMYNSEGVDTGIRLCLAKVDTSGNPVSGIVHKEHIMALHEEAFFNWASTYQWNPDKYLNIFILDAAPGFASFAWDNIGFQGIVVSSKFITTDTGIDILLHELGHYLGLYHTFGKTNSSGHCDNDDCLSDGDQVCDTPPQIYTFIPCVEVNSCNTDAWPIDPNNPLPSDQADMYDNYMTGGVCRSRFTQGQVDRMHWMIQEYRSELIKGVDEVCQKCKRIDTDFEISSINGLDYGLVNQTLLLKNHTNENPNYEYYWYANDSLLSTERDLELFIDYPSVQIIRLEVVSKAEKECEGIWSMEKAIDIRCTEKAIALYEPENYEVGQCYEIKLEGIDDLKWYTNETQGNGNIISFCPEVSGSQYIYLEYGESNCYRKDSIRLFVEGEGENMRSYFKQQMLFPNDSIASPNMMRIRQKNANEYVIIGEEYFNQLENKRDTAQNFIRFWNILENEGENWMLYHTNKAHFRDTLPWGSTRFRNPNMQIYFNDFVLADDGSIYFVGYEDYFNYATLDGPIIGKINALGGVEWSRRIRIPEERYDATGIFASYSKNTIALYENNLITILDNFIIKFDINGKLLEAKAIQMQPKEDYFQGLNNVYRIYTDIKKENIWIGVVPSVRTDEFYEDYNDILNIHKGLYLMGSINTDLDEINYSYYEWFNNNSDLNRSIQSHIGGATYYRKNDVRDHEKNIYYTTHDIILFNEFGEIKWQKSFRESWLEGRFGTRSTNPFQLNLENGDIIIISGIEDGNTYTYLRLDKYGELLERRHYDNHYTEMAIPFYSVTNRYGNPISLGSDGILLTTHTEENPTSRIMSHHIPLENDYFTCDQFDTTFIEVDTMLIESDLNPEITLDPVKVILEDIELHIQKSTFQSEVWCEESYELEDYILLEVDAIPFCPDSINFDIQICRSENNSTNIDTTNLLVYESSPLETEVSPLEEISIIFESDEVCINHSYTSTPQDYSFFLNAEADYRTPFTLQKSFFDGNQKLEWEYRNNYYDYISECDSIVSMTITISSENKLKIFPNPAKETLHIQLEKGIIQSLKIYNLMGQKIVSDNSLKEMIQIPVKDFSSGIYMVEVKTKSGGVLREKVMIE